MGASKGVTGVAGLFSKNQKRRQKIVQQQGFRNRSRRRGIHRELNRLE